MSTSFSSAAACMLASPRLSPGSDEQRELFQSAGISRAPKPHFKGGGDKKRAKTRKKPTRSVIINVLDNQSLQHFRDRWAVNIFSEGLQGHAGDGNLLEFSRLNSELSASSPPSWRFA